MTYYQLPPEVRQAITASLPELVRANDYSAEELVEAVNVIMKATYKAPKLENVTAESVTTIRGNYGA